MSLQFFCVRNSDSFSKLHFSSFPASFQSFRASDIFIVVPERSVNGL